MKTNNHLPERTIEIYLQIAESARLSADCALTEKMLLAAHKQIVATDCTITARSLTRLAELLTMQNRLFEAEETFNRALKNVPGDNTNIWLLARIHDGLTEVYIRLSDLQKARKKCQKALRLLSKMTGCEATLLLSRKRKLLLLTLLLGHRVNSEEILDYLRTSPYFMDQSCKPKLLTAAVH